MINLETAKALRALRLPGMARELEAQLEDPQRYKGLSFEDRLALLVDAESLSRHQNTIRRRIRDAKLSEGDLISARGYGRVKVVAFQGESRRGRQIVQVFKYGK